MKSLPYYTVRNSKIHGRGVFAKRPIRKGTKVIEYTGDIVSDKEANDIGIQFENGHGHTMLFSIGKDRVINGNVGGDARYINHGCTPNCEAVQSGDKIFIESLRSIKQGEELTYDYHLEVPGKITEQVKKEYACFCGSPECRGTQIAVSFLKKQAKKDEKKRKKEEKKSSEKAKKEAIKASEKKAKADAKAKVKLKKNTEPKASKKDKKNTKKKDTASSLMVDKSVLSKKDKKKKNNKKK